MYREDNLSTTLTKSRPVPLHIYLGRAVSLGKICACADVRNVEKKVRGNRDALAVVV